jgi:hypothetical protein
MATESEAAMRVAAKHEARRWLTDHPEGALTGGLHWLLSRLTDDLPDDPACPSSQRDALGELRAWHVWQAAVAAEILESQRGFMDVIDRLDPDEIEAANAALEQYRRIGGLQGQTAADVEAALHLDLS